MEQKLGTVSNWSWKDGEFMVNASGPAWNLSGGDAAASLKNVVLWNEATPPDPSLLMEKWKKSTSTEHQYSQRKGTKPCSCQPVCHPETMLLALDFTTSLCPLNLLHVSQPSAMGAETDSTRKTRISSQHANSCPKSGQYTGSTIPTEMGVHGHGLINLLSWWPQESHRGDQRSVRVS